MGQFSFLWAISCPPFIAYNIGLPLLYALIVPTLFSGWYYSHYALANGIWYALIVLGLISWGVSLVRKIHSIIR